MTEMNHTTDAAAYTGLIVEYSPVDAAIAELRERYADVLFPVETKKGMEDAKDVRRKLIKLRTGLEALRKDIKEPALRRTQAIDAEAKAITNAIKAIEEPIDAQIKAEEQRIEAEKAAKAAREATIKGKIDGIRKLAQELALAEVASADIAAEREALAAFVPTEEVFAEFTDECKAALTEADAALAELFEKVVAREQAAALVAAEQAKLEAERRAFEEEKAAYEAERRAFEARKAAEAEASSVAASGSISAPVDEPQAEVWNEAEQTYVMPVVEVTAEEAAQVFTEAPAEPAPVSIADWKTRRLAMATADQLHALAAKVEQCGFAEFADQLRTVGNHVHGGGYDAALAGADHEALIAADNLMLDATVEAIDAISEEQQAAA